MRLLLPIDASDESLWSIGYALRLKRAGKPVEAIVLNVGEPVTQWEPLRFRTRTEISRFQAERGQAFIDAACRELVAADIPCQGLFRQGEIVATILATAEEQQCDAIVMPSPKCLLARFLGPDVVGKIRRQHREFPVVFVNKNGEALNG